MLLIKREENYKRIYLPSMSTHTHTHAIHKHVHAHARGHIRTHTHMHTRTHMHTHTHTKEVHELLHNWYPRTFKLPSDTECFAHSVMEERPKYQLTRSVLQSLVNTSVSLIRTLMCFGYRFVQLAGPSLQISS